MGVVSGLGLSLTPLSPVGAVCVISSIVLAAYVCFQTARGAPSQNFSIQWRWSIMALALLHFPLLSLIAQLIIFSTTRPALPERNVNSEEKTRWSSAGRFFINNCSTVEDIVQRGEKLSPSAREAVTYIIIGDSSTLNELPSNFFSTYPNLNHVDCSGRAISALPSDLFVGCPHLKTVNFRGNSALTSLPSGLFRDCKILERAIFDDCSQLKNLPASLFASEGTCPFEVDFSNCSALTTLDPDLFKGAQRLTKANFRNCKALEELPPALFTDCPELLEVDFGACVALKKIPAELFASCENLQRGFFDRCLAWKEVPPTLFSNCRELMEVDCSSCGSIENLSAELFAHCPKLQRVNFSYCRLLKTLPSFKACPGLKSVSLTSCDNLEKVSGELIERLADGLKLNWRSQTASPAI